MALSSNQYAVKLQKLEKILAETAAPKVPEWPKLWQYSQRHPKPAVPETVQRLDQGKFFQTRPKSIPPLKGPTELWRKWHYPHITMHFLWFKRRLRKCQNGQVMAIFARSPKTRIF